MWASMDGLHHGALQAAGAYPARHACSVGGDMQHSVKCCVCMQGEHKDLLFLSTERYKFCVLEYDTETGVGQSDASIRGSQNG